ncbi:Rv0361 family membrane protein [Nocardia macrotermitis]|uniref:Uncharacterized protein n=1 Tax=Nocardia macrotermitis TaxID=2585198 RepID=A0A7K0DDV9_9NOCA|nr:hypothetical protein [Nocardia macrotermitis]MQY23809.1 hypothetical protein [Nocardia macrotermitis]
MSDPETAAATPIDQREAVRSPVPFIAAAVIAVLVIGGVLIAAMLRPAEKNVTNYDRLVIAIQNFGAAQSGTDTARRAATACPGFDPAHSPLGPDAAGKKVVIVRTTDPTIDGKRAKVTVTSSVNGRESTSVWNLRQTANDWFVCSV